MDDKTSFPDYYKILECEKSALPEEIKKNYQRLALMLHPDKQEGEKSDEMFLLVQKAWSVLRDPVTRKQYDAELTCHEHSELLIYEAISVNDMDYDANENIYSYSCRCGGTYLMETNKCMPPKVFIPCDECSFSIEVSL